MAANLPSALALAGGKQPRIPIVSNFKDTDEGNYVLLERKVGNALNKEKRVAKVPIVRDDDAERLCRNIIEFMDACDASRLNYTSGPLRFNNYRLTLQGAKRDMWDTIVALPTTANTIAGFDTAIDAFIVKFLKSTDLGDMKHYLSTSSKPFKLSCVDLASRLRSINRMLSLFPGANNVEPYDEYGLKELFFRMMLQPWKNSFGASAHNNLADANFTLDDLVTYMSVQESIFNQNQEQSRRFQARLTGALGRGPVFSRGGMRVGSPNRNSLSGRGFAGTRRPYQGGGYNPPAQRLRVADVCHLHPHGSHTWQQCSFNPQSPHFRGNQQLVPRASNPYNAGRGGFGRGAPAGRFGGAGRGFGRGGRAGGYYNNRGGYASRPDAHTAVQSSGDAHLVDGAEEDQFAPVPQADSYETMESAESSGYGNEYYQEEEQEVHYLDSFDPHAEAGNEYDAYYEDPNVYDDGTGGDYSYQY